MMIKCEFCETSLKSGEAGICEECTRFQKIVTPRALSRLTPANVTREENQGTSIEMGQWYWTTTKNHRNGKWQTSTWLGCVIEVGSNYATVRSLDNDSGGYEYTRVHFNDFDTICRFEPNAKDVINKNIERYKRATQGLMGQIQQITAALAIPVKGQLGGEPTNETQALAVRTHAQPVEEYKQALIKAQTETLPNIFKRIEESNKKMASWMKAALIPMKASAESMKGVVKKVSGRIFNVELYAGLIEEVEKIKDGEPAPLAEPIHVFQRRAYMDEECLANYEAGGMEFKDISAFDQWIIKPENLSRILPFPRSIIAFRIRRYEKEREIPANFRRYIQLWHKQEADKLTFLYMRNGEQVFRLETGIQFDEKLFPDMARSSLEGVLYAKKYASSIKDVITESEYLGLVDDYKRARKAHADLIRSMRAKKIPRSEWWHHPGFSMFRSSGPRENDYHGEYFKWDRDSVYYDDVEGFIQQQMDEHNRLVLVLQGLLDRSEVFHPHPPYQLWSFEGFSTALRLVYDDSRALTSGPKPDLKAYCMALNKNLKVGDITIGQQYVFEVVEAEKENARRERLYSSRYRDVHWSEVIRFKPEGNPGPGMLARVKKLTAKGCTYTWFRARRQEIHHTRWSLGNTSPIPCQITVPTQAVLNVNAYTPGDYKIFFNDPRTRAEYLQWATLFLEAEEWYAGNRKVQEED